MTHAASLYFGRVMHERLLPFRHRFTYRVFSLLLDIDQLPALAAASRLFRHNRFGLLSFFDRDHGPRDGSPLRPWVEAALQAAGLGHAAAQIRIFCFPRLFGYAFNPLSVYFCADAQGRLGAILYEVKNTFGDQHSYLIPVVPGNTGVVEQHANKVFHVSPFLPNDGSYEFRILPPGKGIGLHIRHCGPDGLRLIASQTGRRVDFSDTAMLGALMRYPLMTVKIIAAIHWQALFIWRRGAAFFRRPAPPATPISVSGPPVSIIGIDTQQH